MSQIQPSWWKWAIFNEDGLCGISSEAPSAEKKQFQAHLAMEEKLKEEGVKI